MKLTVNLYRVTTIPTSELIAAAQLNPEEIDITEQSEQVARKLREEFYPHSPRFKVFWETATSAKIVVGMQAMAFDVRQAEVPQAGTVFSDPMDPRDVARIDGALEGELNRMNISTEFEGYEWRLSYQVKGN